MLLIALLTVSAALAGALSGALTTRWLLRRRQPRKVTAQPVPFTDPALKTEIERAAGAWAEAQGRPEASGLVADKLHLLHHLGQRRGWWSR